MPDSMSTPSAPARRLLTAAMARRVPWKNGRGSTLELVTDAAPGEPWTWRLALADVPEAAPFSAFPGIDRCIAVLDGAGLTLRDAEGVREVPREGEGLAFAGEEAIVGEPLGAGVRDANLMLARGVWRGGLHLYRSGEHAVAGAVVVVHAAGGAVGVVDAAGAVALGPGETLVTGGEVRVGVGVGVACAVVAHFRSGISPSKPTPLSA
jgi:environmental stress-induced protein Ves